MQIWSTLKPCRSTRPDKISLSLSLQCQMASILPCNRKNSNYCVTESSKCTHARCQRSCDFSFSKSSGIHQYFSVWLYRGQRASNVSVRCMSSSILGCIMAVFRVSFDFLRYVVSVWSLEMVWERFSWKAMYLHTCWREEHSYSCTKKFLGMSAFQCASISFVVNTIWNSSVDESIFGCSHCLPAEINPVVTHHACE